MTTYLAISLLLWVGPETSVAQTSGTTPYLLPGGCAWMSTSSLNSFDTNQGDVRQSVIQQITSFRPDEVFYGEDGDDHGADWKTRAFVKLVRHSDRRIGTFMIHGMGLDLLKGVLPSVFPKAQKHSYAALTQNQGCGCILKLQAMAGKQSRPSGIQYSAVQKSGQAIGLSEKKGTVTSNCYFPASQMALGQRLLKDLGIQ
ncbi:MAG: hypothetical protein JNL01_06185 [Bdellovibrionales bacterium]|nr:hypothetical protein [Bdellovibrionales bacterium]